MSKSTRFPQESIEYGYVVSRGPHFWVVQPETIGARTMQLFEDRFAVFVAKYDIEWVNATYNDPINDTKATVNRVVFVRRRNDSSRVYAWGHWADYAATIPQTQKARVRTLPKSVTPPPTAEDPDPLVQICKQYEEADGSLRRPQPASSKIRLSSLLENLSHGVKFIPRQSKSGGVMH